MRGFRSGFLNFENRNLKLEKLNFLYSTVKLEKLKINSKIEKMKNSTMKIVMRQQR